MAYFDDQKNREDWEAELCRLREEKKKREERRGPQEEPASQELCSPFS